MHKIIPGVLFFLLGAGAGALFAGLLENRPEFRSSRPGAGEALPDIHLTEANADLIADLRAENERLRAQLSETAPKLSNPYPDDSIEKIELLMENAFAENNVDWLLEVIERLLLMGEDGYPLLRRLIERMLKFEFMPGSREFRPDHLYTFGKIFNKHERAFIGFLNYLLIDNRTVPIMRQGAMMGAAFYVGSKAPGSEDLRETLIRKFLEEEGGVPGVPFIPPRAQERLQVMAMAMSGDPAAIPALQDKLRTAKDERTKGEVINALAYLGDESVLPKIQERLDPQSGDFRREIDALARIDTAESHETAASFLKSIPNSKSFYRHASRYVRSGGGVAGVMLIQERVQQNPNDPEVARAIGTLHRYPTKESLATLDMIAQTSDDDKIKERAAKAAESVQERLDGVLVGGLK